MEVPNNHTIQQAREKRFMQTMTARLEHQHLPEYQRLVEMYLREHPDVSAQDLAAVLALASQQDKPWVQKLPEIKGVSRSTREREPRTRYERGAKSRGRDGRETSRSFGKDQRAVPTDYQHELFRIDVGRVHGVKPGNIVGAIANEAGLQSRHITALKIHDFPEELLLIVLLVRVIMEALEKTNPPPL